MVKRKCQTPALFLLTIYISVLMISKLKKVLLNKTNIMTTAKAPNTNNEPFLKIINLITPKSSSSTLNPNQITINACLKI